MKSDLQALSTEMDQRILALESGSITDSDASLESILKFFSDQIILEDFSSPEEEINFFKNVAPLFFSKLIYFQKLYTIRLHSTHADLASRKRLFKAFRKKISYFFEVNASLISYYASGGNANDQQYFLRSTQQILQPMDDFALFVDTRICTVASYKIAKMLAYKKLDLHLLNRLDQLNSEIKNPQQSATKKLIQWTASKTAATELVYSLFSSGIFNNGQARLKEIIFAFEQSFQIDLGGYQSAYQDMKMRKKSRTAFLSELRQNLESKMDEEED
jgi:hypothetical protein